MTKYKQANNAKIVLHKQSAAELRLKIAELEREIETLEADVCNFQFESHEEAEDILRWELQDKAENACKGSHNRGADEYTQPYQLIGDSTIYFGKITVQYSRHDKTYYYVYDVSYSYE